MSVHNCGLRSSFLEKIPPEPPHASAQRREAVQVSHRSHLCRCSSRPRPHFHFASCRCKFASCAQTFLNAGKLKRHVRYAHGDKNKYFKVCLNTPPCPQDGTKMPRCKKKTSLPWKSLLLIVESPVFTFNHLNVLSPQCNQPNCPLTFKKRRVFKLHLKEHEMATKFKYVCSETSSLSCCRVKSLCSFVL